MALGIPHPDQLARMLSQKQLAEWHAFGAVQPFGLWRDDFRAASIIANLLAPHAPKNAGFTAADFMPFYPQPKAARVDDSKKLSADILAAFQKRDTAANGKKRRKLSR